MTEEAVSLSRKVYGLLGATFLSTLRSMSSQLAPRFPLDLKITIDIFWVGAVRGFFSSPKRKTRRQWSGEGQLSGDTREEGKQREEFYLLFASSL